MTVLAIELNDAGLLAASAQQVSDAQPGIARFDDATVDTGTAAAAVSRLVPHQIEDAYWHRLSLEPMNRTARTASTFADLAHAQLQALVEPFRGKVERVLLGVPGSFSASQLGLVLGICQRADIPVTGLADAAVAAVTHPVPGQRMLHVDATNHCVVITELVVNKGLHRADVTRIDNVGLLDFSSRWAVALGDLFVKQTRFDPMHSAREEQHLYAQLPDLLDAWLAGQPVVSVRSEGAKHEASVDVADLSTCVAGLIQPIVGGVHGLLDKGHVTTVMLSSRMARLPGLEARLAEHDHARVVTLDAQAVTRSLLNNEEHFSAPGGKFSLIKSKPWQETPSVVPDRSSSGSASPRDLATHVLIDQTIYALSDEPFVIGTAPTGGSRAHQVTGVVKGVSRQHCSLTRRSGQVVLEDTSTYGTQVNGKRVASSQPLNVGDRIRIGNPGIEMLLVREASLDG